MCGRFTLTRSPAEIAEHFGLSEAPELEARFNIAPSQPVAVVRGVAPDAPPRLDWRRWGLVPRWARDPLIGNRLVNARAETASQRPAFRDAMRRRRCLVPADGFYEWKREGRRRRAYHIALPGRALFAMAGLYETWEGSEGAPLESCTILTTAASGAVAEIHARMPVLVAPSAYREWLDPALRDGERALALVASDMADALVPEAVGSYVNDPRHEGARCLERDGPQTPLFESSGPDGAAR